MFRKMPFMEEFTALSKGSVAGVWPWVSFVKCKPLGAIKETAVVF